MELRAKCAENFYPGGTKVLIGGDSKFLGLGGQALMGGGYLLIGGGGGLSPLPIPSPILECPVSKKNYEDWVKI